MQGLFDGIEMDVDENGKAYLRGMRVGLYSFEGESGI